MRDRMLLMCTLNGRLLQGVPGKKMTQSLQHHNVEILRHRVMQFSAKCSGRNCLHDKGQRLNAAKCLN